MGNITTDIETPRFVIAMAKEDNKLKIVELRKHNGTLEVVWTKCSQSGDTDWRLFAAECGLSVGSTAQADANSHRTVVVGFDSAGMAFYRLSVPAAGKEELAAMVKLQAETRLPLPAEQMELAWRVGQMQNGQVRITLAAARKEQLKGFVENVRALEPQRILLDCEGIVKSWRTVFSGNEEAAVVVSTGARSTQVCLAEGGQLSDAVVLDLGILDFSVGGTEEQTENAERFAQDMRSVLDLFGCEQPGHVPIFVLSDDSPVYVDMVSSLRLAGFNARVALPSVQKLRLQSGRGVEDIHEYRVPIGLALMALEAGADELNIFDRLYSGAAGQVKKHWWYSPKVGAAIAAAMLILLVIISYAVDVAGPNAIEERLAASSADIDIDLLMQRQRLIKTVAQQRPDLLDLLSEINESGDRGIKLASFHFKKGQRVTITGEVSGNELLYRFEESLQNRKDIKEVKMTSTPNTGSTGTAVGSRGSGGDREPGDSRGPGGARGAVGSRGPGGTRSRGLRFTITFHYKNFTK